MLNSLVKMIQFNERLAQKEVTFDQALVHFERAATVLARVLPLLQLKVTKRSVREERGH